MAKRNLVAELRQELVETEKRASALRSAISALSEISFPRRGAAAGRPRRKKGAASTSGRKPRISAAGRRRISEAQKARWARQRVARK